jgi:hypothetical protein
LRLDIFSFIYFYFFICKLLFLFSRAEIDLTGKSTRLVYKRKATFKNAKKTTLIAELASRRLDFEGEPTMARNDDNRPLREFASPRANDIQLGYTVPTIAANNFE